MMLDVSTRWSVPPAMIDILVAGDFCFEKAMEPEFMKMNPRIIYITSFPLDGYMTFILFFSLRVVAPNILG